MLLFYLFFFTKSRTYIKIEMYYIIEEKSNFNKNVHRIDMDLLVWLKYLKVIEMSDNTRHPIISSTTLGLQNSER